MSGIYINFPSLPHYEDTYKHNIPRDMLADALAEAMCQINGYTASKLISVAGKDKMYKGILRIQVGLGHGPRVIYFKSNSALRRTIVKVIKILRQPLIDFGFKIYYRYFDGTKWQAVRSDEYLLRIILEKDRMIFKIKLIRGLGRLDPQELTEMILERLKVSLKNLGVESPEITRAK
ncbi:MAG: hypothetical protein DRJ66_04725 [Thermoprotei archaeon]|nr:MAG: hypothetical protein DRJ66_04725 [Thermoprotei archaeon]RLF19519.1 MAG: hypothetical protein DRZ82_05455 [Thermoprotei archaeon]